MHAITPRENAAAGGAPAPWGRVFSVAELAREWQLSENSIRRLFQDQAGVFVLGQSNPKRKRSYCTLRIPEGVALRVWRARGGGVMA
jgi:hypothetical protein